jgi:hypothetical protein
MQWHSLNKPLKQYVISERLELQALYACSLHYVTMHAAKIYIFYTINTNVLAEEEETFKNSLNLDDYKPHKQDF